MPREIECPRCRRLLVAPVSGYEHELTCPRCLAAVSVERQAEHRESGPSCPRCGAGVDSAWRACPSCGQWLRGGPADFRVDMDRLVRRDTTATGWVVLAVIGALGVGLTVLAVMGSGGSSGFAVLLFEVAPFLCFLAGVGTLVVFIRSRDRPETFTLRRVVVGTFAVAGCLVLVGAAIALAVFVYVMIVCSGSYGHV